MQEYNSSLPAHQAGIVLALNNDVVQRMNEYTPSSPSPLATRAPVAALGQAALRMLAQPAAGRCPPNCQRVSSPDGTAGRSAGRCFTSPGGVVHVKLIEPAIQPARCGQRSGSPPHVPLPGLVGGGGAVEYGCAACPAGPRPFSTGRMAPPWKGIRGRAS